MKNHFFLNDLASSVRYLFCHIFNESEGKHFAYLKVH